ncbi:rhodanese domain protein [Fulvitalea axinellae]|uniref:Rhodanese domain protein n=1 Tax=Fulvitalea axinellae TaxID=1182444 RepID=A0AAU9CT55_9BACT|nr:rhodanese domain protein [Fulvitalea axinellae]
MKTIDALGLKEMRDQGEDFVLIDVREENEYQLTNIGGEFMPLSRLNDFVEQIPEDKKVVVMCRSGVRSARAIEQLERLGFENCYNLEGGILDYGKKVDKSVIQY